MTQPERMRMPQGFRLSDSARQQALAEFLPPGRPLANIAGFGTGVKWTGGEPTGEPALLVFVTQKMPMAELAERDVVPEQMSDGTRTDVVTVGHLMAQRFPVDQLDATPVRTGDGATLVQVRDAEAQLLARRLRPAPAGVSVGNVAITAGTLGSVVYDLLPGATTNPPAPGIGVPRRFYILSNNHVLAASNAAPRGSAIVQPGPFDGGVSPQDRIASLTEFIPIQFSPQVPLDQHQNTVDAAIAECEFADATRETYFSGAPRGWRRKANVAVGDVVKKTGRTTNLTTGRIISVDATVDVNYGGAGTARFRDQIITTGMSAGGDSGSLVTMLDDVAIGLLFAGSTQVTIVNHIENVRTQLKVEIAERLL